MGSRFLQEKEKKQVIDLFFWNTLDMLNRTEKSWFPQNVFGQNFVNQEKTYRKERQIAQNFKIGRTQCIYDSDCFLIAFVNS